MSKLRRGYLNSKEEGFYIMLEAALAYISGRTEETDIELNNKKTNTFNISYVDKYTAEKLERDINNKTKYAVIDRELFNDIIEDIADVRCVNCHKNYEECSLYKVLEDSLTPAEGTGNCPYSCEL